MIHPHFTHWKDWWIHSLTRTSLYATDYEISAINVYWQTMHRDSVSNSTHHEKTPCSGDLSCNKSRHAGYYFAWNYSCVEYSLSCHCLQRMNASNTLISYSQLVARGGCWRLENSICLFRWNPLFDNYSYVSKLFVIIRKEGKD